MNIKAFSITPFVYKFVETASGKFRADHAILFYMSV